MEKEQDRVTYDIHLHTAAQLLGVPESEVTARERRLAKSINYLLWYRGKGIAMPESGESLPSQTAREK